MIRVKDEMEIQRSFLVAGGNGTIEKQIIMSSSELEHGVKMFARVTLPPKSSIGEHQHVDDAEVYYIISGEVIVTDNQNSRVLHNGDVVYTNKGGKHSITNNTDQTAEFIAIILE